MATADQLRFCKVCKNQTHSYENTIICRLTNEEPTFKYDCDYIVVDKELRDRIYQEKEESQYVKIEVVGASNSYVASSMFKRLLNYIIDTLFLAVLLDIIAVFEPRVFQIILSNELVPKYTLVFCSMVIYFVFIETLTGKSVGKYFTKTKVVDLNGGKPSFGRIILRTICRLIPFEMFSFLFFSEAGWHDILSKTRVVEDKKN